MKKRSRIAMLFFVLVYVIQIMNIATAYAYKVRTETVSFGERNGYGYIPSPRDEVNYYVKESTNNATLYCRSLTNLSGNSYGTYWVELQVKLDGSFSSTYSTQKSVGVGSCESLPCTKAVDNTHVRLRFFQPSAMMSTTVNFTIK